MNRVRKLNRREFLQHSLSAGLVLSVACRAPVLGAADVVREATGRAAFEPSVFLGIDTDGAVTIVATRSEMGQGVRTSLPRVLADELDADWSRVRVVQAPGDPKYGSQSTGGSASIRTMFEPMRQAGAAAREMLVAAAAARWSVPADECRASNHRVRHDATGRSLDYGELSSAAAALPVPDAPRLKDAAAFRYVGNSAGSVDATDMTRGSTIYAADVRLPGLRYATVVHSPVVGGTLDTIDESDTVRVARVSAVIPLTGSPVPSGFNPVAGVAVVADTTWAAMEGARRLKLKWEDGPNATFDSANYRRKLEDAVRAPARVVRETGDVTAALATGRRIEATYYTPLLAHATMETPTATAWFRDDRCEVWAPVQDPQTARDVIASNLGLEPEQVTVRVPILGGGFGRKSKPDFAVEAALLSREIEAPVTVTWSREEDIRQDYFHACAAQHYEATLGPDGMPVAWLQRAAFPSISSTFRPDVTHASDGELQLGFTNMPYRVPNFRAENGAASSHLRIGWLRSVCNIFHAFGVNSFADELAAAAGRDPLDYRLALLGEPRILKFSESGREDTYTRESPYEFDTGRLIHVLKLAAEQAGWGRKLPAGHGMGLAIHYSFLSFVAQVVEVAIDDDGRPRVVAVDCAVDCGRIVNPDSVVAQIQGAVMFGISATLMGEITARDGRIVQGNFHNYPVARISDTPQIRVHLVENARLPTGIGEPGVPPVAPAIAAAIHAATGRRVRELPIRSVDQTPG